MDHDQELALPRFVHEHSKVLIVTPIRIVVIILFALILRAVLFRVITRLTRPAQPGGVPKILSPLRERVASSSLLESAGLRSQRHAQRAATIASVLKSCVSFAIFGLTILLVLSELDVDLVPFIAGTSIIGVAVAFGAQNVVKDFLSGMFMLFEDQYGVGDVIDFEKASGTVEAVGLRTTTLRDVHGTVWYVRNGEVVRVGNKSQGYARVVLDIPIDAHTDVERASAAIAAVAMEVHDDPSWTDSFLDQPEVQGVESMSLDQTVIRLVARVRPADQGPVARELRRRIRPRLGELGAAGDAVVPAGADGAAGPDGADGADGSDSADPADSN